MKNKPQHITVYEHESLKVGKACGDFVYTSSHQEVLEAFYGSKGLPYYSLINKGVKFNEFVGVLSIGNLTIEVLPKADKYSKEEEWRDILIKMLQAVGAFQVFAPSSSALKTKQNYILDLYFELFVKEVEYLYHKGLVKQYRKEEENQLALKGSLHFNKHLQKNIVHAERFFVKHTVYDQQHLIHQILYKALQLLKDLNTKGALQSRIASLLIDFPEQKDLKISEYTFDKLVLNRKTEDYKYALDIARLLLLNYHPDLSKGQNNVLALMFDMNHLWEQFVYISLKQGLKDFSVSAQTSKVFWRTNKGKASRIRPDIVLNNGTETIVLDTKWKNIGDKNPSSEDLRQMFVYHEYYNAKKVALIYPGPTMQRHGSYAKDGQRCAVLRISTNNDVGDWKREICSNIREWIRL